AIFVNTLLMSIFHELIFSVPKIPFDKQFMVARTCSGINDILRILRLAQCKNEPRHKSIPTSNPINHFMGFVNFGNRILSGAVVYPIKIIVLRIIHEAKGIGYMLYFG